LTPEVFKIRHSAKPQPLAVIFENGNITREKIQMRINIAIFFLFCFTKVYSQQANLVETREYWGNGQIKTVTYSDGTYKQGIWQYYDTVGRLIEEERYINGNKYFFNKWVGTKQVIREGNGQLHEYYYNGKLKATGQVKEGKKYGKWTEYYINGDTQNILDYTNWPINYQSETEFNLQLVISYDTSGFIIGKEGTGVTYTTNNNGKITKKAFYTNNFLDSIYKYYDNGIIQKIDVMNRTYNILITKVIFSPSGEKEYEENVLGDTIIRTKWYNNGQVREINKMTGSSEFITEYNSYGQKIKELECTKKHLINERLEEIIKLDCNEKNFTPTQVE